MNFRICNGVRERIVPASIEVVEQAFAPEVAIQEGTEITLADGERWLAALALGAPSGVVSGESGEFLLSGESGEGTPASGRAGRSEILRRFREFVLASAKASAG